MVSIPQGATKTQLADGTYEVQLRNGVKVRYKEEGNSNAKIVEENDYNNHLSRAGIFNLKNANIIGTTKKDIIFIQDCENTTINTRNMNGSADNDFISIDGKKNKNITIFMGAGDYLTTSDNASSYNPKNDQTVKLF